MSPNTVLAIEKGKTDPSFGTLSRLLDAAGFELAGTLRKRRSPGSDPAPLTLVRLAQMAHGDREGEPDWTTLRAALDFWRQHPNLLGPALRARPAPSGSARLDTLFAGIAEKLADDAHVRRPTWTAKVPPLAEEWIPLGTPQMIERWKRATPPQLRARGLVVDEESLWRPEFAGG